MRARGNASAGRAGGQAEKNAASAVRREAARPSLRANVALVAGLGALVALLIDMAHRTGAFTLATGLAGWKPFVAGFLAACAVVCVAEVLFYAKDGFSPLRVGTLGVLRAALGAVLLATGALGCLVGPRFLLASLEVVGVPWAAGGVLAGAGFALVAPLYGALPAGREAGEATSLPGALGVLGGAFFVAVALNGLFLLVPDVACAALFVLEVVLAAGCPLVVAALCGQAPAGAGEPAPLGATEPFSRRVAHLARETWKPVVGAVICAFIFGFTWDTETLGVQLNALPSLVTEKLVGCCLAGAFLLLLGRYRGPRNVQAMLFNTVLPVMVVTFILRPYFLGSTLGSGVLMVFGVARETGFALFMAAAVLALTRAARACNVSGGFAMAAFAGSCALAALLGMYWLHALGAVANYVGAILFTAYLIVTVVLSASAGQQAAETRPAPSVPASPDEERALLDRVIETRCARLAQEYGLSPREGDILLHLGRGHSYAYIANALTVSENTVRTHVRNLYRKMGVTSREELLAILHGE